MTYKIMQQKHSAITAVETSDPSFKSEVLARKRAAELKSAHGGTHFFWVMMVLER